MLRLARSPEQESMPGCYCHKGVRDWVCQMSKHYPSTTDSGCICERKLVEAFRVGYTCLCEVTDLVLKHDYAFPIQSQKKDTCTHQHTNAHTGTHRQSCCLSHWGHCLLLCFQYSDDITSEIQFPIYMEWMYAHNICKHQTCTKNCMRCCIITRVNQNWTNQSNFIKEILYQKNCHQLLCIACHHSNGE